MLCRRGLQDEVCPGAEVNHHELALRFFVIVHGKRCMNHLLPLLVFVWFQDPFSEIIKTFEEAVYGTEELVLLKKICARQALYITTHGLYALQRPDRINFIHDAGEYYQKSVFSFVIFISPH